MHWVTRGTKPALSDLCHTTLLWVLHVPFPWGEIILSGIWCKILHREGTSSACLVQNPSRDHGRCANPFQRPWQMEAAGAAEVLASTVLFMVDLQSVVTLNSLWDCPGLVSQCNSAQGLPI